MRRFREDEVWNALKSKKGNAVEPDNTRGGIEMSRRDGS